MPVTREYSAATLVLLVFIIGGLRDPGYVLRVNRVSSNVGTKISGLASSTSVVGFEGLIK